MSAVLASLLVPLRSTAKACQNILPYLYKEISFFGSNVFTTQITVKPSPACILQDLYKNDIIKKYKYRAFLCCHALFLQATAINAQFKQHMPGEKTC